MSSNEIPQDFPELDSVVSGVNQLKNALMLTGEPLNWKSSDGEFAYYAYPIDEKIEYADLPNMTFGFLTQHFNVWQLTRISMPDINGDVTADVFRLIPGLEIQSTRHDLTREMITGDLDLSAELMQTEQDTQTALGINEPGLMDYGILDDALFDLKPYAEERFHEQAAKRANMTEDEIRWERQQKYSYLRSPEYPKDGQPRFWGFTEGSMVHLVNAVTPDEAAIKLEDYHERSSLFPIFFVDPYDEASQILLQEKYTGRDVVRLIPFSSVEWPSDPDNMSEEQIAAFDRLKR